MLLKATHPRIKRSNSTVECQQMDENKQMKTNKQKQLSEINY